MWNELQRALATGDTVIAHGATAGWSAWLAAQLPELGDGLVVVVAPDDQAARRLEADIRFFRGAGRDRAAPRDRRIAVRGSVARSIEPRPARRDAVPADPARAAAAHRGHL